MYEIPEAAVIARQLNESIVSRKIVRVVAAQNPHKFAWYTGDPAHYPAYLTGKQLGNSLAFGGMVQTEAEDYRLLFSEGINLRLIPSLAEEPAKHQLLLELDDGSALVASVAMYGAVGCFPPGANDNPYYLMALEKPGPLSADFDADYFAALFRPDCEKLSFKAFLATEQRIPGLGNGVLQDILFQARLHPRRKVASLDTAGRQALYQTLRGTLQAMLAGGGRDTERDLFGRPGGYRTLMSKNTAGQPCPVCSAVIQKESYLGGSVYFCPACQPLN
jgi:formamidopyrimidine-DNA glycosylase